MTYTRRETRLLQHDYTELNDLGSGQSFRSGPDPSWRKCYEGKPMRLRLLTPASDTNAPGRHGPIQTPPQLSAQVGDSSGHLCDIF
jgi:hypothetical protein